MSAKDTKHWAVLIGINFYVQHRPLQGCARDVETMKHYIQTGYGQDGVDISLFTATGASATDPTQPKEEPECWPTYGNVVQSLVRILELSNPGETVYVHFSGHGVRVPDNDAFALVLYDHEYGSRLLHGQLLSSVLDKMTGKGLFVTLTLDCCFSGTIIRGDEDRYNGVRETWYDPVIDAAYPCTIEDLKVACKTGRRRDAFTMPRWLANPNHTIFTACGPHEIAHEIETEIGGTHDRERRGALSYFLIEALILLRRSGIDVSNASLYQHLLTKFHVYWPRQTPMRRGERQFSFFGHPSFESDLEFIPVFKADDDRVYIDIGHAQDVQVGDEYRLFPFNTAESARSLGTHPCRRFQVISVGCFTSELMEIQSRGQDPQIETGWKARLVTHFAPQHTSVRVERNPDSKAEWIKATERRTSLNILFDGEKGVCQYNVCYNTRDEYQIYDTSLAKVVPIAPISAKEKNAMGFLLEVVQHFANVKRFEGITNRTPNKSLENLFNISCNINMGHLGNYEVKHGDELQFKLENNSQTPLYLTLFDIRPSGQIKNLMLETGVDFIIVEAEGTETLALKMEIPGFLRDRGDNACEDTMKFFVATRGMYYPSEILPGIPSSPRAQWEDSRDGDSQDPLASVLSELESLRTSEDTLWQGHWTSRNFVIHTFQE